MGIFSRTPSVPTAQVAPSYATTVARSVPLTVDAMGVPAVSLSKVEQSASPSLVKQFQKTGVSLSKRGLTGIRAQVVLVLDHSGSMHADYVNGKVQALVERALAFGLNVDVDGEIEVIAFDSKVWPMVNVNLASYSGIVDRTIFKPNQMGSTNLTAALDQVRVMAETTNAPLFCVVVTDGEPNDRQSAKTVVCQLASYPVFVKFLAVRPVQFLQELDDLSSGRLLDNVDAKFIGDPAGMPDLAFADAMVDEWGTWVAAAKQAGVLRG